MSLPVASGLGNQGIFVFNTITTLNLLSGPMLLAGQCPVGMVTWVDLVGQKSTDCPLEATQTLIPIILQRKICVDMGSTRVALEL